MLILYSMYIFFQNIFRRYKNAEYTNRDTQCIAIATRECAAAGRFSLCLTKLRVMAFIIVRISNEIHSLVYQ